VWIVAIPWMRGPILATTESAGLRTAVLVTATVLFFPPLALLGMVSPYAVRLKASRLEVVGRTVGNLYAISTVASVVAAVVTGFFLIPSMGVHHLTVVVGLALMVTAGIGLAATRGAMAAAAALVVLGAAAALAYRAAPIHTGAEMAGVLAVEYSPYAEIRVVEQKGMRFMLIDGGTHTIVDVESGESQFPYVDVLDIPKLFFDAPGQALLVGLGGGSVVKRYAGAGWSVDAVEIDPVVARVAYEHFDLGEDEADVFQMDGRQYLTSHPERSYDLVIMDAFGSSSIPFHLVTREAFSLIRSRLAEGGILAMNIEAVGWRDILVYSLARTMESVFESVVVLPIAEPPNTLGNLVLLASDRSLELSEAEEPGRPDYRFSAEYNRAHAWDNRFEVEDDAPVLTDAYNPVDVWAERINLVARKRLHEYFETPGVSW
jgi:spermidine synthase